MNKYYGLRLARTFFIVSSVVISISIVATIGAMGGMSVLTDLEFDPIQAFFLLVIGGLLALISYAFGQLIDLNLKNYEVSWQLRDQLEEANRLNTETVALLNQQMTMMGAQSESEIRRVEEQIKRRRETMS